MSIDERLRIIAEKLLHPKFVRTVDSPIEYAELEAEVLDQAITEIKKVIAEEQKVDPDVHYDNCTKHLEEEGDNDNG